MLEEYYQFKRSYPEFVLMIKAGNFYEILDKDAVIMNQVLGYKLTRLGDNVKCGFPISSLEKVIGTLEVKQLNYVVIENRKNVKEKDFENNIYHTFLFDMNHIKYHLIRINKIIKYLNENMDCENDEVLEKIESIIYGR